VDVAIDCLEVWQVPIIVAEDNVRALLEMDGIGEAVRGEHLVRDLERLLEAGGPPRRCPPISRKTWLAM
jgi:hypothetical protein